MKIINVILTVSVIVFCVACQNVASRDEQNLDKKVQNIKSFARLYGYARWFHPSDEAQEIDWDKFAILGIQKVANAKSPTELRDTLYRLFSPIVQGLQIFETNRPEKFNLDMLVSPDPNAKPVAWQHYGVYLGRPGIYNSIRTNRDEVVTKMFDRVPQFGEITKAPIGNNLICVVPLTLLTNGTSTYPKTDRLTLARLQSELDNINIDRHGFNLQINLASVVITWNVLQHFFPYFDVINTDWDEVLGETLKSTLTNRRRKDFFVTLSRMISKIHDGHGIVLEERMYLLPIRTELIENKIVITASNDSTLKRGDIILEIDGKLAIEALYEKKKIISGSPQLRRYRALNVLGSRIGSGNRVSVSTFGFAGNSRENKLELDGGTRLMIERNGNVQNVIVANSREGGIVFNPIDDRKHLSETIVEIEPGIFYVNMRNSTENDFRQKIDVLANARAVIYDQRGGSRLNFFHIVPHLIETPVTSPWWNVPQTIYPNRKAVEFHKSNWSIQSAQPRFNSKTIIINSPSVVSAGETIMGIIDHYNLAITVGETTAGCNGNINSINTPSGYTVTWTGMKVLKHDGSQHYLIGYAPDYPIHRTIQAVREGRDEVLEKALKIARR